MICLIYQGNHQSQRPLQCTLNNGRVILHFLRKRHINILKPGDALMREWTTSPLVQVTFGTMPERKQWWPIEQWMLNIIATTFNHVNKFENVSKTSQSRHNERDVVSNHRPHGCLLNCLFRRRSKKHQSSASLYFVRGIHRWPVNSPHKRPVTRKMFPFDDVIMMVAIIFRPQCTHANVPAGDAAEGSLYCKKSMTAAAIKLFWA